MSRDLSDDTVGLALLRLIVGHLIPIGAPLTVAVDDTLFRCRGHKVYVARPTAARCSTGQAVSD